jgi:hypothetical protein
MTVSSAQAGSSRHIRATGSGVRAAAPDDVPFTFWFDATTLDSPNRVLGYFSGSWPHLDIYTEPGDFATLFGVVTHLAVTGNHATIAGILTSGYGYDNDFEEGHRELAGDWFMFSAEDHGDPEDGVPTDTVGFADWGDREYFTRLGYPTFLSMCDNPTAILETTQFPLISGQITISAVED